MNEAEELVALAQKQRRILMVGHTFEYSPAVNELRNLVQSGDLGKIYCVEAERVNLGLFRSDINVIWDLAPHDISILLYLFGQRPEQVSVQAHAHLRSDIHDVAHIDWIEPLRLECEDFVNAIRTGSSPRANGHVGLEVVRVLAQAQAILDAQRSFRTVLALSSSAGTM